MLARHPPRRVGSRVKSGFLGVQLEDTEIEWKVYLKNSTGGQSILGDER